MTKQYFGTDGIRGEVGVFPITPDFALKLGYAVGVILKRNFKKPAIIIGKDTRLSGYLFESSLEAGFSYAGVDVYMAGPVPTPAVAYLTRTLHLSAGVVISASHNPYQDNGIKFFSHMGAKFSDKMELEIEQLLGQPMEMAETLGKVRRLEDAKGRYIEFCKSTFPHHLNLNHMKIVLDVANGATYQIAPSVFEELGADVVTIANTPNGININHNCGSTHEQNLIKAVKDHNADIGIAFDGDGDRVIFVDNNGLVYNGDKLLYAILQYHIHKQDSHTKNHHKSIVGTVMTNLAMEHAIHKKGYGLIRAKVGDRYVLEELHAHHLVLGGEASGHILCLDKHTTGDGIISALQVLKSIIALNKPLNQLIDWEPYPQKLINIKLDNIKNVIPSTHTQAIITDAEEALKPFGRVVVRKSGTEPLIRVMVEAKLSTDAQMWADKIALSIGK